MQKGLFLSIMLVYLTGSGIKANSVISEISDTTHNSSGQEKHSLFGLAGYGNNMIYLGSTISENRPYEYASLVYGFNSRFYASVSSIHLDGTKPFLPVYSASMSYSHVFNSWFDLTGSVSAYHVSKSLTDTLFSDFIYSDLTLGVDWRLLYTTFSAGAMFSNGSNPFLQVKNSRYFKTPEFFKNKSFISFDPYFNLLFGNYTTIQTTSVLTGTTTTTSSGRWGYGSGINRTSQSSEFTTSSTRFKMLTLGFGVPVTFNSGKLAIEAEAGYIIPAYKEYDNYVPDGFQLSLSLTFRLF